MNFEKFPGETNIVSRIFHSVEDFQKAVAQTLEWSKRGGPRIGTSSFIRAVTGRIRMSSDDFASIKEEINEEVNRLEAKKNKLPQEGKAFTEEETKKMIKDAEKKELRELKRSGGVDPNEI